MRAIFGGLVAVFAFFFVAAEGASAQPVECPLSQARRTITNDLPTGWWTTPIVNDLTETRVQDIGGEPALMCIYGPSGSIQREAPANTRCTARTGGFECRPTLTIAPGVLRPGVITPAPQTLSTGPLSVPQTYLFDLDNGAVGASGDIWFHAVTATQLYLEPSGGAQMAVGDRSNRGRDGCAAASYSTARAPLSAVPVGSYVCVRTNEGRISQFRVNAISSGSPKTLSLGYTTWQ